MREKIKNISAFLGWTLLGFVLYGELGDSIPLMICIGIGYLTIVL